MKVEDLLNPSPTEDPKDVTALPLLRPPLLCPSRAQASPLPKSHKQKLPKDAPIFRKGPTKGDVLFPPHEAEDGTDLAKQHEHFQVFPRGEIAQHCHHIPYSSDKKTFLTKTGRDAFEVFQYTFKLPGEDREYVVMWDYNIGLVRITPFFKCCKYSKTTPAKVLNANPGLRDISHSITGGALSAQGYWMPFACAKAVAATFCYHVRYALTPLFGKDFADNCVHPIDAGFANFKIDGAVIKACTVETQKWLHRADTRFTPGSSQEPSEAPGTPKAGVSMTPFKKLKPRLLEEATSPESGYGTDTDWSDCTPKRSPETTWLAINSQQTTTAQSGAAEVSAAEGLLLLSSPKAKTVSATSIPGAVHATTLDKRDSSKRGYDELEHVTNGDNSLRETISSSKSHAAIDSSAALVLLQLRTRGATIGTAPEDEHREKRQRRSSVPHQIP